ncbi:hypothetical protein C2857_001034 [Epichloe festucae Fl1]|uniref:Aminoglycoside phosphotransferase domain-containing protein n=1 Tax=Epichloe festucae (strain Fl1) TaxID=877507 RepID=A0A7U3Q1A7_EPIFF|nr:hypothetical protein C2857_001034 [Epichloe festucae Fl1]
MEKPSDHWQGFSSLHPESDKYKRIQTLISSANFKYLENRGVESRRKHEPNLSPQVRCTVNVSQFTSGFHNLVLELAFSDSTRIGRLWCGEDAEQPVEIIAMAWHSSPGPLETSLEYFYNQRQAENREIVAMHPDDPEWLTACWVLKAALSHIIIEDRVRGPFPLCHLDLHSGNMLFDDEYNLSGIIDWSSAQAAPLEQLSVCPELVTGPGLTDEGNRPMV